MSRRLPALYALRAFEAAARHSSFTRAAEELSITQSAVSRHIRTLEEHGLPLALCLPVGVEEVRIGRGGVARERFWGAAEALVRSSEIDLVGLRHVVLVDEVPGKVLSRLRMSCRKGVMVDVEDSLDERAGIAPLL